jgi:hypothetical protein
MLTERGACNKIPRMQFDRSNYLDLVNFKMIKILGSCEMTISIEFFLL